MVLTCQVILTYNPEARIVTAIWRTHKNLVPHQPSPQPEISCLSSKTFNLEAGVINITGVNTIIPNNPYAAICRHTTRPITPETQLPFHFLFDFRCSNLILSLNPKPQTLNPGIQRLATCCEATLPHVSSFKSSTNTMARGAVHHRPNMGVSQNYGYH